MISFPFTNRFHFKLFSALLFFIFGGAIVGENVALSMIIPIAGPGILSKMYIVNGLLLFGLPVFFFRYVDRVRREQMLSIQLLCTTAVLVVYLVVLYLFRSGQSGAATVLISVIYPVSYLTKTMLFLTFWTLANDVCDPVQAKRAFPTIAAWGLVGGLCGALVARSMLRVVDIRMIVWLWIGLYLVAFFIVRRVGTTYRKRLQHKETVPLDRVPMKELVREVLENRLVRVISLLYFLVFVAVFSLDFLFWKQCHDRFPSSHTIASFQFSFYVAHAIATALCLWFVTPRMIAQRGFAKLFFVLPSVLIAAGVILFGAPATGMTAGALFGIAVALQFMRHMAFENAFSPIYQMFFTAVPREQRGRAKTFLEGIVKPSAILITGMLLTSLGGNERIILVIIIASSAVTLYLVQVIRRTYIEELVPGQHDAELSEMSVREIGSKDDPKIVSLIVEYADSPDGDFRRLAVEMLAFQGSAGSLARLIAIYDREPHERLRELIACSLERHRHEDLVPTGFIDRLLRDENPRIRANAIYSLNSMNGSGKGQFMPVIEPMLFDTNLRIQIEAARYVWSNAGPYERNTIQALVKSLLASRNANRRSAGIYIVGELKTAGWEKILIESLGSLSLQVFTKSIETILRQADSPTIVRAMTTVEGLSRRHVSVAGKAAQGAGSPAVKGLLNVLCTLKNRRMFFEVVHALRVIRHSSARTRQFVPIPMAVREVITHWILAELETVYRDGFVWHHHLADNTRSGNDGGLALLGDALARRMMRIAEWALDTMVLLDSDGIVSWGRRELDFQEYSQRLEMVEILENLGENRIGALVTPILKFESWEEIARIARVNFHCVDKIGKDGLAHFAQSENRWVGFCGFYSLFLAVGPKNLYTSYRVILERLSLETYDYAARAARTLLETAGETLVVETFALLETALFLKQTPMFRNIAAESLIGLAEICELKKYGKDMVVSREGYVSDHLFVVRSGSLDIVKAHLNTTSHLAVVGKGETYGEIGLFSQSARSATAIAREESELYEIQRSSLKKLLMNMPEIAFNFLEIFSDKLRRSGDEIASLASAITERTTGETVSADRFF